MDKTVLTCLVFVWAFERKKLLVIRKLRGMGKNKWNFPGGKKLKDESLVEAARRELFEETGIGLKSESENFNFEKAGVIYFYFDKPEDPGRDPENWSNECHLFCVDLKTQSLPTVRAFDSAECEPFWADFESLPWKNFWPLDKEWVPKLRRGEHVSYEVFFDSNGVLKTFKDRTKEYTG